MLNVLDKIHVGNLHFAVAVVDESFPVSFGVDFRLAENYSYQLLFPFLTRNYNGDSITAPGNWWRWRTGTERHPSAGTS